jgi:hypothetical protein
MGELGYGDFPDIKSMAVALSAALEMLGEQTLKIHELEAKVDQMKISSMTQTGGFMPRNRRPIL